MATHPFQNMINWHEMDASTQKARNRKAKQIRLCRKYLSRARVRGYSAKSTTVQKWTLMLRYWRDVSVYAIVERHGG